MPESVTGTGAVARLAALPGVRTASAVADAAEQARAAGQVLPVSPALTELLPHGGLRRGTTVAVRDSTSLLLALLAEATARGSWAAVVGAPRLGLVAAGELGVELGRLALVPHPGAEFAAATAALLDGFDLVAVRLPPGSEALARRLSARARHRGAVLLSFGPWPGAEVELRCRPVRWSGPADGHGHLEAREVVVEVTGRAALVRPVRSTLLLPGPEGTVRTVPAVPSVTVAPPVAVAEAGAG
ncbi:hypothetical protein B1813_16850 [Saccharomonospora piscinae]|uniref:Protein ImuA n=1 Tax=Saccharomonospora piscinae TaxID=687388 RepID=A0A1V9A1Z1_SACPI|nr:hypothetical protein [Saccharomonospora piscinae]OQO91155.1 hypothetical protein B1813_16850 [Saccharomonospora piscinae]